MSADGLQEIGCCYRAKVGSKILSAAFKSLGIGGRSTISVGGNGTPVARGIDVLSLSSRQLSVASRVIRHQHMSVWRGYIHFTGTRA